MNNRGLEEGENSLGGIFIASAMVSNCDRILTLWGLGEMPIFIADEVTDGTSLSYSSSATKIAHLQDELTNA